ncbi:hypothetical protein [Streptomyces sp. NPDC048411]|uniref:hypothetical protein n=1 Tax=Streptomyces sp. NPDC048411 TaxID=3157206 RepID=UPI0034549AE1
MLAANLAADLDAWLRLLTLHDKDELADAEPETMRFRGAVTLADDMVGSSG